MKKTFRIPITIVCVIAGAASFLYLCLRHRDILGEYYAASSINVEMDREYAKNIAIAIETSPWSISYWLSPTTITENDLNIVVMHKSIPLERPFWNPALQFPLDSADAALAAIDNVAFFVGNKLFYFTREEIGRFRRADKNGYALFYLPGIHYERSLIFGNWSNYYGDFNFIVRALTAFLLYPARFAPVYLLLLLLLLMYRKRLGSLYAAAMCRKKMSAVILFVLIVAAGFILRYNGYVRHSGWSDEIYSAVRTGNPMLPFITTFIDGGNPPFYFILLRFWFVIFGWSEESGTMLSVALGTFSIITLYLLVKPFFGRKAALCAALFVAFSGFSIGYSREMRSYILQMALAPLISLALFSFIKKPSFRNLLLYVILSMGIANAHFYGILFVMANFLFYVIFALHQRQWHWRRALFFFVGNAVVALSFLPYFFYMLLVRKNSFIRSFSPEAGHTLVFLVILLFFAAFLVFRREIAQKISEKKALQNDQKAFAAYLFMLPAFVFMLAYIISFIRPMITFRYLWPINAPFCFAIAAVGVVYFSSWQKWRFVMPLLVYMFLVGLYGISPDIPGRGVEAYKEARAYIAADAAAHPERKAAMLDNAPYNAAYYGFPRLPAFSESNQVDVLYVYNDIFKMNEMDMLGDLRPLNPDYGRLLRIYFDYKSPSSAGGVIFKYIFD